MWQTLFSLELFALFENVTCSDFCKHIDVFYPIPNKDFTLNIPYLRSDELAITLKLIDSGKVSEVKAICYAIVINCKAIEYTESICIDLYNVLGNNKIP